MTRLVWHQWAAIGLTVILAGNAAAQSYLAGLFAFAAVLAVVWGFVSSNDADAARVERDAAVTWARRRRESQR